MNRTDKRLAVKYGVIAGLLFTILCFGCWSAGVETYATFLTWYTWIPAIFVLILVGAFQRRKQLGGVMTFKEALAFCFLAYVIYEVFYAVSTFVLYRLVDPTLQERLTAVIIEKTRRFMEGLGAKDSQIDDALETAEKNSKGTYSIAQIVLGFGYTLIYDFVKSIILAAITQKRKPEGFPDAQPPAQPSTT
jgi:hypothetical protein